MYQNMHGTMLHDPPKRLKCREQVLNQLLGNATNTLAWPKLTNYLSDHNSPYLQAIFFQSFGSDDVTSIIATNREVNMDNNRQR